MTVEDSTHMPPPHEVVSPPPEAEAPLDFASLDLWEFTSIKQQIAESSFGTTTFQKKGKISIGEILFSIDFEHKHFENDQYDEDDTVYMNDNFEFKISKNGIRGMNAFITIQYDNSHDKLGTATLFIERPKDSPWGEHTADKGMEFYKKMLDFIQRYVDEKGVRVHHVASKYSKMSDEKWHKKFDPILIDKKYNEIHDDPHDKWEKMYYPTPKN